MVDSNELRGTIRDMSNTTTTATRYELRIELVTGVSVAEQRNMSLDELDALLAGHNFGSLNHGLAVQ